MSSVSVLGAGILDGLDGAMVELVCLEMVTSIYINPGYCYNYCYNGYSWMGAMGLLTVV